MGSFREAKTPTKKKKSKVSKLETELDVSLNHFNPTSKQLKKDESYLVIQPV